MTFLIVEKSDLLKIGSKKEKVKGVPGQALLEDFLKSGICKVQHSLLIAVNC